MQKTNNLQDLFLLRARKSHASLTVFLMNGYQLRGQIKIGRASCRERVSSPV